jgi:hypothetical protein
VCGLRTPELGLRCSTTYYDFDACVVLGGLRPTWLPQWHNGSWTPLRGMCHAMWRSKHSTLAIRPELTSCHRSASAVGRGVFFCPEGRVGAREMPWMTESRLVPTGCFDQLIARNISISWHVGTTLWELNFHPYRTPSCYSRRS